MMTMAYFQADELSMKIDVIIIIIEARLKSVKITMVAIVIRDRGAESLE